MGKQSIFAGIIGLVIGLSVGFIGANYLNSQGSNTAAVNPTTNSSPANPSTMPVEPGMIEDVQKSLDKAKSNPKDKLSQLEAGEMYFKIKKFDEALGFFQKAYDVDPAGLDTNTAMAKVYFEKKQFPLAAKHFELALKQSPNNPSLLSDLGLSYYLREPKELEKAVEYYELALKEDEKFEAALQNLVLALEKKQDPDGLLKAKARLQAVNPNNPVLKKQ